MTKACRKQTVPLTLRQHRELNKVTGCSVPTSSPQITNYAALKTLFPRHVSSPSHKLFSAKLHLRKLEKLKKKSLKRLQYPIKLNKVLQAVTEEKRKRIPALHSNLLLKAKNLVIDQIEERRASASKGISSKVPPHTTSSICATDPKAYQLSLKLAVLKARKPEMQQFPHRSKDELLCSIARLRITKQHLKDNLPNRYTFPALYARMLSEFHSVGLEIDLLKQQIDSFKCRSDGSFKTGACLPLPAISSPIRTPRIKGYEC